MKLLISLMVLLCQWSLISCNPGIIRDAPDFRKAREKTWKSKEDSSSNNSSISTKLPSYNSITDIIRSTTPSTTVGYDPIQLTADDVVMRSNTIHGSQQQQQQQLSNGGVIFAISQSQGSTSQPSANSYSAAGSQPVLLQYLSPEGTPQQASVQYIQLLRPLMMVPAQNYQPVKPIREEHADTFAPSLGPNYVPSSYSTYGPSASPTKPPKHSLMNPYGLYSRQSPMGSYSSPFSSYVQSNPRPIASHRPIDDIGFNMNEYLPSASSLVSTVLAPRSSVSSVISPYASYRPTKFHTRAQRA